MSRWVSCWRASRGASIEAVEQIAAWLAQRAKSDVHPRFVQVGRRTEVPAAIVADPRPHSFSNRRIALQTVILAWLQSLTSTLRG